MPPSSWELLLGLQSVQAKPWDPGEVSVVWAPLQEGVAAAGGCTGALGGSATAVAQVRGVRWLAVQSLGPAAGQPVQVLILPLADKGPQHAFCVSSSKTEAEVKGHEQVISSTEEGTSRVTWLALLGVQSDDMHEPDHLSVTDLYPTPVPRARLQSPSNAGALSPPASHSGFGG